MLSGHVISKAIGIMSLMKFFPAGDEFRAALMEMLGEICETDEQVIWLARRMRNLYQEWPGSHELRACFCAKHSPKDGLEVFSAVYHDGIPSERTTSHLALPGANPLMIEGTVTADLELEAKVIELAAEKAMPKADHACLKDEHWLRVETKLRQMGI